MIFGGKFRALWNKIRQAQTSRISLLHLLFLQKQQKSAKHFTAKLYLF
jgi:hypothetical protein